MARQQATRQRIRKALVFISFLLFPITIYYFSPYLIIDGAFQGIVNGSFIAFALMFLSALFVGRFWCGWACPGAGLQEACFAITDKPARTGKFDWIKWGIWIPWVGMIAFAALSAGGYRAVNVLYMMESGVSIAEPASYPLYYIIVGIFLLLALAAGRRAGCHYICWMAPFMILGRKIRNLVRWPALRLKADPDRCNDCKRCNRECSMSLDVNGRVRAGSMEHAECILCGVCVDVCPKDALRYSFSSGK